jgi:hypothetical protein
MSCQKTLRNGRTSRWGDNIKTDHEMRGVDCILQTLERVEWRPFVNMATNLLKCSLLPHQPKPQNLYERMYGNYDSGLHFHTQVCSTAVLDCNQFTRTCLAFRRKIPYFLEYPVPPNKRRAPFFTKKLKKKNQLTEAIKYAC